MSSAIVPDANDPDLLDRAREALSKADFVCPHTDADGLAAGAIALLHRGQSAADAVLLGRGVNPWHDNALPAGYPAILDQGIRSFDRPALFVDHHAPEATPREDQVAVSGYGEAAGVSTSVLMRRVCPDAPPWLAAVGAAGDYGDDGLKRPECAPVVKAHVKKLVPLVNAPRRGPDLEPVRLALAILMENDSPKAALNDERIGALHEAKAAYRAAFEAAVKTAPKIAGDVALIRFTSPYQIHPLVAQTWLTRLRPKVVIAANDDYLPGMVNFAARGGPDDLDLRKFLKDALPDVGGEFAHGHDKATGGSLSHEDFARLLAAMGFGVND